MTDSLYSQHLETFRGSLEKKPDRAYEVYRLSLLYSLDSAGQTREKYRLGIQPKSAHDFYNLGVLANGEGRHEEALNLYKMAEDAGADFPELYFNLGLTYENLKKTAKAVAAYQAFAELARKSDAEELQNEAREVKARIRELKG